MDNSVSLPDDALKAIFNFLPRSAMARLVLTDGQFADGLYPDCEGEQEEGVQSQLPDPFTRSHIRVNHLLQLLVRIPRALQQQHHSCLSVLRARLTQLSAEYRRLHNQFGRASAEMHELYRKTGLREYYEGNRHGEWEKLLRKMKSKAMRLTTKMDRLREMAVPPAYRYGATICGIEADSFTFAPYPNATNIQAEIMELSARADLLMVEHHRMSGNAIFSLASSMPSTTDHERLAELHHRSSELSGEVVRIVRQQQHCFKALDQCATTILKLREELDELQHNRY